MRWMDIAWQQQGVTETAGEGATPEIVAMFRDSGYAAVTSDETPWCAAFVGACLERAGLGSSRSLLASSYEKFGTPVPLDQPRVGCICVFDVGAATGSGRHVGFVTGWTDTTIAVLGGNQSDSVNVKHFRRNKLTALRWPEPPATAAELAQAGSRTVQAAIGQVRDAAKAGAALASGAVAKVSADIVLPDEKAVQTAGKVLKGANQLMLDTATLAKFGAFALTNWIWIALMIGLYYLGRMGWLAGWIKEARVEDHNTGANVARSTSDAAA